jgi:hypothetical protein
MTREQLMFKVLQHLWKNERFDWDDVRYAVEDEEFNPKQLLALLEELED